jgi:hypothetical protein
VLASDGEIRSRAALWCHVGSSCTLGSVSLWYGGRSRGSESLEPSEKPDGFGLVLHCFERHAERDDAVVRLLEAGVVEAPAAASVFGDGVRLVRAELVVVGDGELLLDDGAVEAV